MTALRIHSGLLFMPSESEHRLFGAMLGVSIGLHLAFLVLVGLRIAPSYQTPLASYEVALVSLSEPQAVVQPVTPQPVPLVQPPPSPPQPVQERKPAPIVAEPPVQKSMALAPAAKPMPQKAVPIEREGRSRSAAVVREALQGLELPPEAPTLTEPVPARSASPQRSTRPEPKRLREEIDSLMAKLAVPTTPTAPPPSKTNSPPVTVPTKPVLSDELRRQLQELQRPVLPEPDRPAPARPPEARPVPAEKLLTAPPAAAIPKRPTVSLDVPGAASGFNPYLAQVQNKISSYWVAPNVGDFRQLEGLRVTVKFRLHRSGKVTDVVIEESSGNEYYDLSGKRAVLSADPLPPFPRGMSEPYFDAHFRFVLGEQAG